MKASRFSIFLTLIVATLLSGCATLHNPTDLAAPKRPTHFMLDQPLLEHRAMGLLNIKHEFGLLPGRYYAERDDGQGTYFRGPAGAMYIHTEGVEFARYLSGGFWMPHDPAGKPHYYTYEGSERRAQPRPDEALPRTSVAEGALAGAAGGALGGAVGGTAAHAINPGFGNNYGQAALSGAGAGLVAGAIIGGVIAMDAGKINLGIEIADPAMGERLRALTQQASPISQPLAFTSAIAPPPRPMAQALPAERPAPGAAVNGSEPVASMTVVAPQVRVVEAAPTPNRTPVKKRIGKHSYNAEQFAATLGCKSGNGAWLIAEQQAGSGRYLVECIDGSSLELSCDAYGCQRANN